jgi:hypothetical protein
LRLNAFDAFCSGDGGSFPVVVPVVFGADRGRVPWVSKPMSQRAKNGDDPRASKDAKQRESNE